MSAPRNAMLKRCIQALTDGDTATLPPLFASDKGVKSPFPGVMQVDGNICHDTHPLRQEVGDKYA